MERTAERDKLRARLEQIEARIDAACQRAGRKREEVKIVAVTKYVDADVIGDLLSVGIEHIGENRAQDAQPKMERYGEQGIWHFIGHLQTNKVKDVVGKFAYIHSLDRLSLAEAINKRAETLGIVVPCFVQINVSGEETKFGLRPNDVLAFFAETSNMKHIKVVGLMTMAPHAENPEETRAVFRELREWRDRVKQLPYENVEAVELSMGMSGDFTVAIEEGATFVRLGSVLVKPEE